MAAPLRVLVLEDKAADAKMMVHELERAGYAPVWQRVETREDYIRQLDGPYDLILADYTLPQFDGFTALRILQERGLDVPFILVSGTIGEELAVTAMQRGATDYLLKDRLVRLGPAVERALEERQMHVEKQRTEQALRASEARLRLITDNMLDMVSQVDKEGIRRYVSPAHERALAYKTDQLLGKSILDCVHPEDAAQVAAFVQTAIESGTPGKIEFRYRHADGHYLWLEAIGKQLSDDHGTAIGAILSKRDVTERKRAEQAVRESEEKYRTLVETSPDAIAVSDLNLKIVTANKRAAEMVGYSSADELIGRSALELVSLGDHERMIERARTSLETGTTTTVEYTVMAKDGRCIPGEANVSVALDAEGKPKAFIGIYRDITERKRAETQLRQQAAHQSALNATIAAATEAGTDLQTLLRVALEQTLRAFGLHIGAIWLRAGPEPRHIVTEFGLPEEAGAVLMRAMVESKAEMFEPSIVTDWDMDGSPISAIVRRFGVRASIVVPLLASGGRIGGLAIAASEPRPWLEEERALAVAIGRQLGITAERARLFEETKTRALQLELLYNAGLTLGRALDTRVALEFLKIAMQAVGADRLEFARYEAKSRRLRFELGVGYTEEQEREARQRLVFPMEDDRALICRVAREREPLNIPDASADPNWIAIDPEVRSGLWVPVQRENELRGVLGVLSKREGAFTSQDERLLSLFANQAAQAMENARLFEAEQSRRSELAALYDLSRALAETDDFDNILQLIVRRAVETVRVTFARAAVLEEGDFIIRAAHPLRALDRDLGIGSREPVDGYPHCQRALQQDEPIVVHADDPDITPRDRQVLFLDSAKGLCIVPVRAGDDVIGLLMLGEARNKEREPFNEAKIRLARSVADQAASALRRARLHQQTALRLQHLSSLRTVDMAITSSFDLRVTLNVLFDQIINQLRVDATALLALNPRSQTLECTASRGFRGTEVARTRLRLGEGNAGRAALERKTVEVPNVAENGSPPQWAGVLKREEFVSEYDVPLTAKGQVKGVLSIFHRAPLHPDSEWLDFLQGLAAQAAIAVDNADLFEGLQRSNADLTLAYESTIEGWSRALDLRDKETEGHTQRVAQMSERLARMMGLQPSDLPHLRRGALLHDIGKVGVPDSILFKPGPLTEEEWAVMRQHPKYAYELLSPIAYLRRALDIPYCHHERWDGTGYPRGLKGESIPLAARIFAIVDVWDALCSERPYRPAWSKDQAREHIRASSASQFDPVVVETFLKMLAEQGELA